MRRLKKPELFTMIHDYLKIFINGHFWGFTYTTLSAGDIDPWKKQLLTIFSQQVLQWWAHNNQPLALPAQNEFFLRLLEGNSFSDNQLLWDFLSRIGWEKEDEKYIIKLSDSKGNRLIYSRLIYHISQSYSYCYVLEYGNSIVLILNTSQRPLQNFLQEMETFFWNNRVVSGISYAKPFC